MQALLFRKQYILVEKSLYANKNNIILLNSFNNAILLCSRLD